MSEDGTAMIERGIASIVRIATKTTSAFTKNTMRKSFVKLMPYACKSKTLRNTLDIMHKKGLIDIISDKVASKCVIDLSNAFDDVISDIGDDHIKRSTVQQFEALLCKAVTYICRLEAKIKEQESQSSNDPSVNQPTDVTALLVEIQQMKDVVSTADRQITHLRSCRDKIIKSKQEELEQVQKETIAIRRQLHQVHDDAKRDRAQYLEKEKALQLVLTQLSSAQEEIKKLKKLTIHSKKGTHGSTFSANDSMILKAYESKRDDELRQLRIGKDILRQELHKERMNRSVDIADLINTQSQIEEYAHEIKVASQILDDENQLRRETEQKVQEYADKLDETQHQLTMSTKVLDTPMNSPVRSITPTRLPTSPMRHHSPSRSKSSSQQQHQHQHHTTTLNEDATLVETLRESLRAAHQEKVEIQRQCIEDTAEIQSVIENMQQRLRVLTEENSRLQHLLQSSSSSSSSPDMKDTSIDATNIHDGSMEEYAMKVDELKKRLLDTTEFLIATRNENITLKAEGGHAGSDTNDIQHEALRRQSHSLTEQLVSLQQENKELRQRIDSNNHQLDSKLRQDLNDAEKKVSVLNEQLARVPPSFHVAMAEKRVLEAKLAKAIDTGDTRVRLVEKQKEKAVHELHSMLSTELSEKEALRNTVQEQALTIHQLTLHLKLLQDASIENERETSKYDIEKSVLLSDFGSDYNVDNNPNPDYNLEQRWGIESRRTIAINDMNISKVDDGNSSFTSMQFPDIDGLAQIRLNEEKFRELDRLLAKRLS